MFTRQYLFPAFISALEKISHAISLDDFGHHSYCYEECSPIFWKAEICRGSQYVQPVTIRTSAIFWIFAKKTIGWPGSAFRAQGRERLPFALNPVHELPNRAKGPLLIRLNRLDIAWQPELTEIWLDEPSNPDQFAPKCVEKAFSLKSSSKQWWIVAKTHRLIMQWRRMQPRFQPPMTAAYLFSGQWKKKGQNEIWPFFPKSVHKLRSPLKALQKRFFDLLLNY